MTSFPLGSGMRLSHGSLCVFSVRDLGRLLVAKKKKYIKSKAVSLLT